MESLDILGIDSELLPAGSSQLHVAANNRDPKVLKLLLERDSSLVNTPDKHGRTPLVVALQNGRFESAKALIEYGAQLDIPFGDGSKTIKQALSTPAFNDFLVALIRDEIELPFCPNFLLPVAASEGNTDLLEKLLAVYHVSVDSTDNLQQTALHYACRRGDFESVNLLLHYYASRAVTDAWGSTPLHLACNAGNLKVVETLLDGSETELLNLRDARGCTPIHIALYSKRFEVLLYFLTNFRQCLDSSLSDHNGHTLSGLLFTSRCILNAVPRSHMHLVPCLSNEEAMWLLHTGVFQKDPQLVTFSISQGASADCCDFMQQTPLITAVKLGCLDTCKVLVQHGSNPNVIDYGGKTPLQYATESGHADIASFLLSLPEIDPTPTFARLNKDLSIALIEVFVAYFRDNSSAPRPQNWLKWLTLAVPMATAEAFGALVEEICPNNWIDLLISGDLSTDDQSSLLQNATQLENTMLPLYCQGSEPAKEGKRRDGKRVKAPHELKRSYRGRMLSAKNPSKSIIKKKPFSFHFTVQPASLFKALPARKYPPKSVISRFKRKPFSFHFTDSKHKHPSYPLHAAALCGNSDVFTYILRQHPQATAKLLQLGDDSGRAVLELAAMNTQTMAAVKKLHLSSSVGAKLREKFSLPSDVTFEKAVLHYIVVGGPLKVVYISHKQKFLSRTPLDKWPQWYLEQQVSTYCQRLGAASLSLDSEEDRKKLAELILEHSRPPLDDDLGSYPSLLCAAVQHKCPWGVQLLLSYGASPAAEFVPDKHGRIRYALTEAAQQCQVELVSLFLQNGPSPFLTIHNQRHFWSSLNHSLVSLTSHGFAEIAEQLLDCFPSAADNLWESVIGSRLLYVALAANPPALNLGSFLARSFASYFVKAISLDDSQLVANVSFRLKELHQCAHVLDSVQHSEIQLLRKLVAICNSDVKPTVALTFHFLCGCGYSDLVAWMLNCSQGYSTLLVNKLDLEHRAPLFYAACGGHISTVQLLVDESVAESEFSQAPISALLSYLCFTQTPLHSSYPCVGRVKTQGLLAKKRFVNDSIWPTLPKDALSISSLFKNPGEIKQLVQLLMPLPTSGWFCELLFPKKLAAPHPLFLLSALSDLTPVELLLKEILAYLSTHAMEFKDSADLLVPDLLVPGRTLTVLDMAVMLAPSNLPSNPACSTFENILAHYASDIALYRIQMAARKGYWSLIKAAASNIVTNSRFTDLWPSYTLTLDRLFQDYWYALLLAVEEDKVEVVASILSADEREAVKAGMIEPLQIAVKHNHVEIVNMLLDAGSNPLPVLLVAARHNRMDAFEILLKHATSENLDSLSQCIEELVSSAARNSAIEILERLLSLYQDPELKVSCEFPDRNLSFWFLVLLVATQHGHESLALQALACISESQMEVLAQHKKFSNLLSWCCYWGMSDLLECLPFTATQLYTRDTESGCSPWECAVAHGHIGKLSYVSGFPELPDIATLATWLNDSPLCTVERPGLKSSPHLDHKVLSAFLNSLFCGAFHKLCTTNVAETTSTSCNQVRGEFFQFTRKNADPGAIDTLLAAATLQVPHVIQVFLEQVGRYAGRVILLLHKYLHIPLLRLACRGKGNVQLLELLLRALFEADVLGEFMKSEGDTLLSVAVQSGSVECAQALLRCGPPNMVEFVHSKTGDNLLHIAIYSGSAQMVEFLCDSLGEKVTDLSFSTNSTGDYPLNLAFILGQYKIGAILLKKVKKSEKQLQWMEEAKMARGWFRAMMEKTAERLTESQIVPLEMDIISSDKFTLSDENKLEAMVIASCGLFLNERLNRHQVLLSRAVLAYLCNSTVASVWMPRLSDFDATKTLCEAIVSKQKSRQIIELLELYRSVSSLSLLKLDVSKLFLAACTHKQLELVQYFTHSTKTHIKRALHRDVLQEGITTAVACGSFEVAVYLQMESSLYLSFNECLLPIEAEISPLVHLIFTFNKGYCALVDKFFDSVKEGCSERLPLSSAWLTHQWGPYETKFVLQQLGTGSAPSQPWAITVSNGDSVSLIIDWDSFSESVLGSPRGATDGTFRLIPLFVEAAVFSPAVLGQVCGEDAPISAMELFHSSDEIPSSVILSCVQWPQEPSIFMTSPTQGLLTLSYNPTERMFYFPPTVKTSTTDSFSAKDSGIQSFLYAPRDSNCYREYLNSMADHIKEATGIKSSVSVHLDDEFSSVSDHQTYSTALQTSLNDCHEILRLTKDPRVLYSDLEGPRSEFVRSNYFQPPKISFFDSLCINIYLQSHEQSAPAEVRLEQSLLIINLAIDLTSSETPTIPPHEFILKEVTALLIGAEMDSLKAKLLDMVSSKVVPRLRKSLRTSSIDADSVSLLLQDESGSTHKLSELQMEHLLHLKPLPAIQRFLLLFSDMLQVMSYKPRLFSPVSRVFQAGLKVVISESGGTGLTLKAGVPQLTLSSRDMYKERFQHYLLEIFSSLKRLGPLQQQSFQDFAATTPAPFMCQVKWKESHDFLYPTVGGIKTLVIQLLSYSNQELSNPPTSPCCLTVSIKNPSSNVYAASSFEDPNPSSPSKHLLVHAKQNGTFEVEWIPQEEGSHLVSVKINGSPISGSPFKIFVAGSQSLLGRSDVFDSKHWAWQKGSSGSRQTSAGSPLVVVVSHPNTHCDYCTPAPRAVLQHHKSIFATALSEGQESSSPKPSLLTKLQISHQDLIHHLNLQSSAGGPTKWFHIPAGPVMLFISKDSQYGSRNLTRMDSHCLSLGNGFYRVSLKCKLACSFRVFAACAVCQAVMHTLWLDHHTLQPLICYVASDKYVTT